jgi:hypothetical protein
MNNLWIPGYKYEPASPRTKGGSAAPNCSAKVFVLHRGDGADNGVGQYIGESVGWTDDYQEAVEWSKANKGYYRPLDRISPNGEDQGREIARPK